PRGRPSFPTRCSSDLALGLPAALSHQGIAFLNELVANDTKLVPTGCRSLQLTLDDLAEHLALTALEAILSTSRLPRGQDAALLQPQESQAMLPAASTTDQLKGAPMSVLTSCDDLIGRQVRQQSVSFAHELFSQTPKTSTGFKVRLDQRRTSAVGP